jgi:hypothetical protein
MLPWEWVLLAPDGEPASTRVVEAAGAFVGFLERLPYAAVLDPAQKESLGLAPPRAVVTLEPREGPPLRLEFGPPGERERVPLWVEASGTLFHVEARTLELALPAREVLTAEHGEQDPWSAALRAADH